MIQAVVAIIPAAGRGTRMASVTGGAAKELLLLGTDSVLRRVIREAAEIAPREIVVVSASCKDDLNRAVESWSESAPIRLAYQADQNGLVGAILAAGAQDDALILNGDSLFWGPSPVSRLTRAVTDGAGAAIAVQTVPDDHVQLYGIVEVSGQTGRVSRIIEKPQPTSTASRLAVAGRYALSRTMLAFLAEAMATRSGSTREMSLSEPLQTAIDRGVEVRAVPIETGSVRIDCGSPSDYEEALRLPWD